MDTNKACLKWIIILLVYLNLDFPSAFAGKPLILPNYTFNF